MQSPTDDDSLQPTLAPHVESVCNLFEGAWLRGERPVVDSFLPPEDENRLELLVELLHIEIEFRLEANEPLRVETYFEQYPELTKDRQVATDIVIAEYDARRQRQSDVSFDEYLERFPDLRDLLESQRVDDPPPHRPNRFPLRIGCPHCQNPIEVPVGTLEHETVCPACGSTFCVDHQRTQTWSPQKLPKLGKFELIEAVGRGAFGTVYRARDVQLQRDVAVKVPRSGRFGTQEDEDRFVREARNAAQLDHPGIVRVYDVGRSDTFPYIISEFVEGLTLSEALAAGKRFGFREMVDLITELANALQHAHQKGIVHRDIKPSNIILRRCPLPEEPQSKYGSSIEGLRSSVSDASWGAGGRLSALDVRPRLMDFGLARRDEGEITVTQEGQVLGTPAYMSPEQARGEGHSVDGRSDVYSLGVILYELLCGELPFRGNSRMLVYQVTHDEPRPPRRLNDHIPRDLETICLKCLNKELNKRYPSSQALADDLRRYLMGEPIQARPIGRAERVWRWCRRNRAVASLAATAAMLLLAVAVVATAGYLNTSSALKQADTARIEADAHFDKAVAAVHEMLTVVGEDSLANVPQMELVRSELLEKALRFNESLHNAKPTSSVMRFRVARANHRLGDIYRQLGQHQKAKVAYDDAIHQFSKLAEQFPNNPQFRYRLGISYDYLGELLRTGGDLEAAEAAYRQALKLQRKLYVEFSDEPMHQQELSRTYNNLGILLKSTDRPADAEQSYQQSNMLLSTLVERFPKDSTYREELARSFINLGVVLNETQRSHEAESFYNRAIQLSTQLVDEFPDTQQYRYKLAVSHIDLGNLLLSDPDRHTDAEQKFHAARELLRKLAVDLPNFPGHRKELANCCNSLASVLAMTSQFEPADQAWAESNRLFEELVEENPQLADYHSLYAVTSGGRSWLASEKQDLDAARSLAEKAIQHQRKAREISPQNPDYRERLCRHHLFLAEILVKTNQHELAIAQIREAVGLECLIPKELDAAKFEPLQTRADFQQLAESARDVVGAD